MASDAKTSEILNNLRRIFQALVDQSKKAEESTGLSGPQLWALQEIATSGTLNGAELARRMFIHPAKVVSIVDKLEERGFVVRVRSKEDRRVVDISLTNEGVKLVHKSPEVVQNVLVKRLDKLPEMSVSQISEGLQQLAEVLGVENDTPRMIMSQETESVISSMRRTGK